MSAAAKLSAVLMLAMLPPCCATTGYDQLAKVRSICDVPFEEGKVVQVSAEFDGDRYHADYLFHDECPNTVWIADWTEAFHARYGKVLELESMIVIGPNFSRYHIEIEGRLFRTSEGRPAIEFQKLGKSERVPR